MSHLKEEQLILYYYGEAEDRDVIEEHLGKCPDCLAELTGLQQLFAEVDRSPVPERSEEYGEIIWRRLQDNLPTSSRWSWLNSIPPHWVALGAAAAVLVAAVFVAGNMYDHWDQLRQEREDRRVTRVQERVLLSAVSEHLERSQFLLTDLINSSSSSSDDDAGSPSVDISYEQSWAEELVGENRLYRQSAGRVGELSLAATLDELERTLLDVAHSPSRLAQEEFENLRGRIDKQDLLFKVKVLTVNLKQRQLQSQTHIQS